jgi:hypothetical protein
MNENIIMKVTIVTSKNGSQNSVTKHIPLGEILDFKKGTEIVSIYFQEVKSIYTNSEKKRDYLGISNEIIDDGFGNCASIVCPKCHNRARNLHT